MNSKRNLILALFFLSLGGWMLHFRIHPIIDSNPANYLPFIFGLLNIFVVPLLLISKRTFLFGYLFNGFGVIIGTIVMTTFSLSAMPESLNFSAFFFKTTLADIFLLFPKIFIGQLILVIFFPNGTGRMFTTSWWVRHFVYVAIVFSVGHFLWR